MRVDAVFRDYRLATMDPTMDPAVAGDAYGSIEDGALAVADGRIVWIGNSATLPSDWDEVPQHRGDGRWLTPGLIDCHTHLVWAGDRAREFEQRLQGASYAQIAAAGGGIKATVHATRTASEDALFAQSARRLHALIAEGVTTVEIKSGYGLDSATEIKLLRVARRLGERFPVRVTTTLLAAHALPPAFEGRADDYVDFVCAEMLPAVHGEKLADAVDAFCESIAFTPAQCRRVFEAATALGLPVKLHADQLSDGGGAALAAACGALSADHLEYTSDAGVDAMAAAGTVAVLLPGAFYTLRETQQPPIARLRAAGVPMALATDCNPGTSPCTSLLLTMNMGCTLFGLTPGEALAGVTCHAARALGLGADRGQLRVGLRADFAIWDIEHPAALAYRIGFNPCSARVIGGQWMNLA
jgi:imidazolonepropionase